MLEDELLAIIKKHPGLSISELAMKANLSHRKTCYRLQKMDDKIKITLSLADARVRIVLPS
jgi:predicted transcriptional regulator